MKTILLSTIMTLCVSAFSYAAISISGPTEVCPYQQYTYDINASFLFGTCGTATWSIKDASGTIIKFGSGNTITHAFLPPANTTYTINAWQSGGIGCFSFSSTSMQVTTKYPVPTISGPDVVCQNTSAVFTGIVNSPYSCFHHSIDWNIPAGLSASTTGGQMTLTAPPSAQNKAYTISARVWYSDRNEYGAFQSKTIWVGDLSLSGGLSNGDPIAIGTNTTNVCEDQWITTALNLGGATTFTWQKIASSPSNLNWVPTGNNIKLKFWNPGQTATFRLTMNNSCDSRVYDFNFRATSCNTPCEPEYSVGFDKISLRLTIEPPGDDPCTGIVRGDEDYALEISNKGTKQVKTKSDVDPYSIEIFNEQQILQYTETNKIGPLDINTINWKPGKYDVIISNSVNTTTHQIVIAEPTMDSASENFTDNIGESFLYPNPAKDRVKIHINSGDSETLSMVHLIDMKGKTIMNKKVSGSKATLDISNMENGIYFVRISNNEGITMNKLIIQN